jgi:hypothetical protein
MDSRNHANNEVTLFADVVMDRHRQNLPVDRNWPVIFAV